VLSGAGFCADHRRDKLQGGAQPPDYGHCFIAIDPQRFMPAAELAARVDRLIEHTKSSERAENVGEIFVPGEMEMRARERSLREGVRLRASTYRALVTYGRQAGLHTDLKPLRDADVVAGGDG
jgi:LDH2 family malate/lactate/ureidoglycolate dehydrogenase